ncbi:MAG TPA: hypothetical protein DCR14_14750 [Acidimicrobiaceae bacterium]|nr:hypothetical protein [Acidimicrobiaceae bacterium]
MTHGFPNWCYIGVSQNAFSLNMTSMFDEQAKHIAYIIGETVRRGAEVVEPTEEAQAEWVEHIHSLQTGGSGFLAQCTPGYYNNEGNSTESQFLGAYTPGLLRFVRLMEEWRATGELTGMHLEPHPVLRKR